MVASCGSITLKAGTQAFRTLDLQGQTCNSGGGTTGVCSEATSYLARTTGGNEGGNASAITTLICGLVNDGVWGKLEAFYVPAQQNVADAKLNLVNFSFTLTGGVATWTQYKGFSNFTTIFDTGYNPGDFSKKYLPTSGSLTAWAFDVPSTSSAFLRTSNLAPANYVYPSFGGLFYCGIHSNGDIYVTATNVTGLYGCDRPDGSTINLYTNGVSGGSGAMSAGPSTATNIHLGGGGDGYLTTSTISEASIGGALGAAGQAALSARMHTYMAAAGSGCPEAAAYLARAPGETTHAADLIALICGLVTDGTWAKLDGLYILAQQTQADARLNLVSASYPLVGTATFVPYQGFSAFTTPALDTGFNPGTAVGAHLQPSDGFIGTWSYGIPDWNVLQMGASTNPGGVAIAANYGGGGQYYCYIGYATPPFNTPPGLPGFYSCDKGDANNVVLYYNGAPSGPTQNQGTAAFPSADMYVGSAAFLPASIGTISEVNFGASIGAVRQASLYARLRSYMTAVGVP